MYLLLGLTNCLQALASNEEGCNSLIDGFHLRGAVKGSNAHSIAYASSMHQRHQRHELAKMMEHLTFCMTEAASFSWKTTTEQKSFVIPLDQAKTLDMHEPAVFDGNRAPEVEHFMST